MPPIAADLDVQEAGRLAMGLGISGPAGKQPPALPLDQQRNGRPYRPESAEGGTLDATTPEAYVPITAPAAKPIPLGTCPRILRERRSARPPDHRAIVVWTLRTGGYDTRFGSSLTRHSNPEYDSVIALAVTFQVFFDDCAK
jgi:hypothetical protein